MVDVSGGVLLGDLVGRERERAVIERLLDGAVAGERAALVLRGEAGIGKTALLELALSAPESMKVLSVTGVEAESDPLLTCPRHQRAGRFGGIPLASAVAACGVPRSRTGFGAPSGRRSRPQDSPARNVTSVVGLAGTPSAASGCR